MDGCVGLDRLKGGDTDILFGRKSVSNCSGGGCLRRNWAAHASRGVFLLGELMQVRLECNTDEMTPWKTWWWREGRERGSDGSSDSRFMLHGLEDLLNVQKEKCLVVTWL